MENIVCICDMFSAYKYLSYWTNLDKSGQTGYPMYRAELYFGGSGRETSIENLFHYAKKVRILERANEVIESRNI